MLLWLISNISTILICVALLAVISYIIYGMIKNKRRGKSSCGCGCGACPMSGSCHQKK